MGITYDVYKVEYRESFNDHWAGTKTGRCRIGYLNCTADLRGEFAFQLGVHPDLVVDWKEVGLTDGLEADDQHDEDNAGYNSIVADGLQRFIR